MKFVSNAKGVLENVTGYDHKLVNCFDKHPLTSTFQNCHSDTAINEMVHGHIVHGVQLDNSIWVSYIHLLSKGVDHIYQSPFYQAVHTISSMPFHIIH